MNNYNIDLENAYQQGYKSAMVKYKLGLVVLILIAVAIFAPMVLAYANEQFHTTIYVPCDTHEPGDSLIPIEPDNINLL